MKKFSTRALVILMVAVIVALSIPNYKKYAVNSEENRGVSYTALAGLSNTKYNFHAGDVLVWAAYVGTHEKAQTTTDSKKWPFVLTEVTANALDKKELVPLDGEDARDNVTNAKDSANLQHLRKNADNSNRFDIAGSLSRKLGISENDINVKVYYTLPECNGEKLLSVANNSEDNWKTIDKQFLDKVFENARKCSTSGKYNNMDLGSGNSSPIVKFETAEDFDLKYNKLKAGATEAYNNLNSITAETDAVRALCDNYDSLSEAEIEELRDRYAKYAMCIGQIDVKLKNGEETESCYRNYLFDIISADAELPDGSIYRLVIGDGTVNGVNYNQNWLLERVKEADLPEELVKEWETKLDYVSYPEGRLGSDGYYLAQYYENDLNQKDVDVTAMIKSLTDETIVSTHGGDVLLEDGTENKNYWSYTNLASKLEIKKIYKFDDYDNIIANGIVREEVALEGGNGSKSKQVPSIKWTFRRKNIEKVKNEDGSITITILFNLPIDLNRVPAGWTAIFDDEAKTTSHRITRTFAKGEIYDDDVPVKQNGTDITVITHIKIVVNITNLEKWETTINYVSTQEGKYSIDGTYLAPYFYNDINEKDVDVTVMIKSLTEQTIISTHHGDMLPGDGSNNKNQWSYTYPANKIEIKKIYRFEDYDNITANGIVNENVPLEGNNGGESEQNPSIKWTFRRKVVENTQNNDGSITVTITFNLPIDINKIPEGWTAIFDDEAKTTSHKITRIFAKDENYDKDVEVKQNATESKVITHIKIENGKTEEPKEPKKEDNKTPEDKTPENKVPQKTPENKDQQKVENTDKTVKVVTKDNKTPTAIPKTGQNFSVVVAAVIFAIYAISRLFKIKNVK